MIINIIQQHSSQAFATLLFPQLPSPPIRSQPSSTLMGKACTWPQATPPLPRQTRETTGSSADAFKRTLRTSPLPQQDLQQRAQLIVLSQGQTERFRTQAAWAEGQRRAADRGQAAGAAARRSLTASACCGTGGSARARLTWRAVCVVASSTAATLTPTTSAWLTGWWMIRLKGLLKDSSLSLDSVRSHVC